MTSRTRIPFLEMRGVCKSFGATVALDRVHFSVFSGEVHALVGENGAGKSTLMKILSGAHQADSGLMFLHGKSYAPRNPLEARQSGVGMMYQELSLVPHLTVEENIVLGMEPHNHGFLRKTEIRKKTAEALRFFNHSEIQPDSLVRDISIGARQLVEIGRSLVFGCRVLVFDEPTSSLTQKDAERLFDLIRQLRNRRLAVVYITHYLDEVQILADRFTVLRNGTSAGSGNVRGTSKNQIIRMMVGQAIKSMYPRRRRTLGKPVLEIRNLAGRKKPECVNLVLHRAEIFGIFGMVGSGRTELLRTVFGLEPIRTGQIKVGTFNGWAHPRMRWKQGMGLLSEDRKEEGIALSMSVADNMTLPSLDGFGPGGLVLPKKQNSSVIPWIRKLEIRCQNPEALAVHLSGGNQQKLAFARLLQHEADFLLLDEPTKGIDVAAKAKIYDAMDRLAFGSKAILMVSSYMPELLGMCDRIAVMHRGKLGPAKPAADWTEHKLMLAAMGEDH